jgi:hypothetical protein
LLLMACCESFPKLRELPQTRFKSRLNKIVAK